MTTKEKRRNTEKRKEKSRDAARCRRSKETEVYSDLSQNLPLPQNISNQLDKASIMRLSISYLNVCNILDFKQRKGEEETEEEKKMNALCSKALEGFLFILSKDGDIVYVSDSVSKYLGIQQIELVGQSIYEFAHPCDHDEIKDIMSVKPHNNNVEAESDERVFFIRMKCTLTSKGRNVNLKSASYKVLKFTGRLVTKDSPHENMKISGTPTKIYPYLLAIGESIPHPANIEIPLDSNTFLTKHDMDMRVTYCDDRVKELVGYNCEELMGQSMYNYHHALDSHVVEKAFKDLFAKGQTMTGQYRMLAKNGGYVWVVTQGTIIYNSRTQKPQWVVCVHYVLSKVENKEAILSEVQLPKEEDLLEPFRFERSTDKIFAPKTKADIEPKYFVPPELKNFNDNEPEDLTHLAPMPSGACTLGSHIESSCTIPFLIEMKEEPGSRSMCLQKPMYFSSTSTSPASMSPRVASPEDYKNVDTQLDADMMQNFFSLRTDSSPMMRSPSNFKSLSSPTLFSDSTKNYDSDSSRTPDLIDMNDRSPFIPMNRQSDHNLAPPSSSDLLKLNNDFNPGLFGRTESVFMPKEAIFEVPPQPRIRPNFRDFMGESTSLASIERAPSMLPVQVKRPRDMNSLEKGPPISKRMRSDQVESRNPGMDYNNQDCGVLFNYLIASEDKSNGFKVKSPYQDFLKSPGFLTTAQSLSSLANILPCLTQQDYEVNAPTQNSYLLHGQDLFDALDVEIPDFRNRPT